MLKALFTRYILATILVILGMALLVWLGFWQLDRQEQKRTFNTLMAERWRMEPFDLTTFALPADLAAMEYRRVAAAGEWDYDNQILISNQTFNGSAGYVVVTPLVLGENRAVLVARGWIPSDLAPPEKWPEIEEAPGAAVLGLARQSQGLPSGEPSTPVSIPQREYYRIDIPAIQGQMPYQLEAGYLEQMPEAGRTVTQFPLRREPMALDEGNHLSYAIQWFTFALVLGFGYIMLVRHQVRRAAGLIVPATHTYQPLGEDEPVAPPVAVSQQEPQASAPAHDAVSETDRLYA